MFEEADKHEMPYLLLKFELQPGDEIIRPENLKVNLVRIRVLSVPFDLILDGPM